MKLKKLAALAMSLVLATALVTGCGESSTSTNDASTDAQEETTEAETDEGSAPGDDAGFEEIPIFEDQDAGGFLNVNAVYFQPVPMSNGNDDISNYNMHIEADVTAKENNVGFPAGEWVPYMTVDYELTGSDGNVAVSGTFMEMNASDGPHYGANIKLDKADTYTVKFTFHSPEENGYLVHTDSETGPGGTFDDIFGSGNLEVVYEGFEYTPQEW